MYYDNARAGAGLRIVFFSTILNIAGIIFSVVPLFGILGTLAALAATPIAAYGYHTASKGHPDYIMAFYLTIGSILLGIATAIFGQVTFIGSLVKLADTVCTTLIVYVVCTTTARLVAKPDGTVIWQLFAACTVLSGVLTLLCAIPIIGWLALPLKIPVALVLLVARTLYLLFLHRAQAALSA